MYRAAIFDLDGTLLDTLADIATSVNEVLAEQGAATHSVDDYRQFVGSGVRLLISRAFPPAGTDSLLLESCVRRFYEVYAQRWNQQTKLYPGISQLLDELVARDVTLTVLSNKPHQFTCECVKTYLSDWPFAIVLGQREGIPIKPDPTSVFEIVQQIGVSTDEVVYAGDSDIDMQTAAQAGLFSVGVDWGFRPREELAANGAKLLISDPLEMLSLFEG